jgi:hypothetical protein
MALPSNVTRNLTNHATAPSNHTTAPFMTTRPLHRRHEIDRIQARIDRLGNRAAELLSREEAKLVKVRDLRRQQDDRDSEPQAGRLRWARRNRALRRAEESLEELRARRERMADEELRVIMLALEKQARKTRERLDEELERLAPVEAEWERLRCTFGALETTVAAPALEPVAAQWGGELAIPEFPVQEREGYARPFPPQALLF